MAKKTKQQEPETLNPEPEAAAPPAELTDSWSETLPEEARAHLAAPTVANKPDISRLPDAFLNGRPSFTEGDKIVIERHVSFLANRPYLDTKTYKVRSINTDTGNLWLWDEQLQQSASDNYKAGLASGCRIYKVAMGYNVSTKKKRGRPRKEKPIDAAPPVVAPEQKRGRGRPKGSKNRSRDEIKADKEAKRALRAAKLTRKRGGSPRVAPPAQKRVDTSWIFLLPMEQLLADLNR